MSDRYDLCCCSDVMWSPVGINKGGLLAISSLPYGSMLALSYTVMATNIVHDGIYYKITRYDETWHTKGSFSCMQTKLYNIIGGLIRDYNCGTKKFMAMPLLIFNLRHDSNIIGSWSSSHSSQLGDRLRYCKTYLEVEETVD